MLSLWRFERISQAYRSFLKNFPLTDFDGRFPPRSTWWWKSFPATDKSSPFTVRPWNRDRNRVRRIPFEAQTPIIGPNAAYCAARVIEICRTPGVNLDRLRSLCRWSEWDRLSHVLQIETDTIIRMNQTGLDGVAWCGPGSLQLGARVYHLTKTQAKCVAALIEATAHGQLLTAGDLQEACNCETGRIPYDIFRTSLGGKQAWQDIIGRDHHHRCYWLKAPGVRSDCIPQKVCETTFGPLSRMTAQRN